MSFVSICERFLYKRSYFEICSRVARARYPSSEGWSGATGERSAYSADAAALDRVYDIIELRRADPVSALAGQWAWVCARGRPCAFELPPKC